MSKLVDIVKNTFRSAALVGVMALTLYGCKKHDDNPPVVVKDTPPVASLSVLATSGEAPLVDPVSVTGIVMSNPIVSYRLYLDGKVDSSSSPITTTFNFLPGTHTVYGEVVDSKRLSSRTLTATINITLNSDNYWSNGIPLPKGKINLFTYPDSSAVYNSLKTKKYRSDFLEMVRASDITPTIPTGIHTVGGVDYGFACSQTSALFSANCINIGDNVYFGDGKMYDWYMGDNFDSIYVHQGGTLKYKSAHKVPVFVAIVSSSHQLNFGVTGNSLFDGKSLDFIETMYFVSRSNVLPNDGGGIPLDYPGFALYYAYTYKDNIGHNTFVGIPVVEYNLANGVFNFVATNPNLDVIMERDTLPPVINVTSPVQGKEYSANGKVLLDEVVTSGTNQISDDSFRYAYYSFDGGATKIAMGPKDTKDLIYNGNRYFKPGNYTLSLYAKNEFYEDTNKNISFTVK